MGEEAKDLDHYLQNPDALPENPEDAAELVKDELNAVVNWGKEQPEPEAAEEPEKAETPEPEAEQETPKAEEPEEDEKPAAKQEGESSDADADVLAKDGKHVIPYSVLRETRTQLSAAQEMIEQQQKMIEDLKAAPDDADNRPAQEPKPEISDEDMAVLEEELPALAKILKTQQQTIESLNEQMTDKLKGVEEKAEAAHKTQQEIEAERQQAVREQVQEAIDNNEALSRWSAEDPDRWQRAMAFDDTLRQDPMWSDKTFAERFEKVVELVNAVLPEDRQEAPKPEEKPSPESLKAKAKEKLGEQPPPASLSDLPGGVPPESDDVSKLENMSPTQIEAMFDKMTPDQMESYLAGL